MKTYRALVVTGPTATGKTSLAVHLCSRFSGEVISVDSRQVYKGLDIGSGKDLAEYGSVPYHLIDIADPTEEYNLVRFLTDARKAVKNIDKRQKLPVLVGGSALYLNALLMDYELPGGAPSPEERTQLRQLSTEELLARLEEASPDLYERLPDRKNRIRIIRAIEKSSGADHLIKPFNLRLEPLVLGVYFSRQEVHERIEARLDDRLRHGMIEEVRALHKNGLTWEKLDFFGLEYRYVALYLQDRISYDEMREKLFIRIRQFAKSQDVWFRKMERTGIKIHWLKGRDRQKAVQLVETFLAEDPLPDITFRLKDTRYGPKCS